MREQRQRGVRCQVSGVWTCPPWRGQGLPAEAGTGLARRCSAFTMLEMLAAVVIMAMMVILMFIAFQQVQRGWTISAKRAEAFQEARRIVDSIASEVSLAISNNVFTPDLDGGISDPISFVIAGSDSDRWYVNPSNNKNVSITVTNEIIDLYWVEYDYHDDVVWRREFRPTEDKADFLKSWVRGLGTPSYGPWVPVTSNVVQDCTITRNGQAVRIKVKTIDVRTAKQIAAGGSESNLKDQVQEEFETQVYLQNSM